jgi:hypothetical protein
MTRLLVVPSSYGGWEVRDGSGAALSTHATPTEAEKAAQELLAARGGEGEVMTQGRPGPAQPQAA